MSIREDVKQASMSSRRQRTWLMNDKFFMVLAKKNQQLIFLKMKIKWWSLWKCCHVLFYMLQKRMVDYIHRWSKFFLFCWIVFLGWTLNLILIFMCVCCVTTKLSFMISKVLYVKGNNNMWLNKVKHIQSHITFSWIQGFIASKLLAMKLFFEHQLLVLEIP